jgi:hypothetical protein
VPSSFACSLLAARCLLPPHINKLLSFQTLLPKTSTFVPHSPRDTHLRTSRFIKFSSNHSRYSNIQSFNFTMKSVQYFLAALGLVSASSAWGSGWSNETTVWTTITTDVYTTYCPESTTFTQGTKTYTATASETLTITGELSIMRCFQTIC